MVSPVRLQAAAEKSGVGAVSIRRREAVVPSQGLGLGDLRTKPISIVGPERQQTVRQPFHPGVLLVSTGEGSVTN
jgi:hypothetical protein